MRFPLSLRIVLIRARFWCARPIFFGALFVFAAVWLVFATAEHELFLAASSTFQMATSIFLRATGCGHRPGETVADDALDVLWVAMLLLMVVAFVLSTWRDFSRQVALDRQVPFKSQIEARIDNLRAEAFARQEAAELADALRSDPSSPEAFGSDALSPANSPLPVQPASPRKKALRI